MRSFAGLVACGALLGACGDDGAGSGPNDAMGDGAEDAEADAYTGPVYRCWPPLPTIPNGTLTLGAGGVAFSPMGESLPLEYGVQGGFMVKIWPRIDLPGFVPGKLPYSSPENPFSRVRAKVIGSEAKLQGPGDCGFRQPYVPNDLGGYDLMTEWAVVFDTCWQSDLLIGAQIELEVEVMDVTGNYVTATRTITATEPVTEYPVGVTDPSCGQ